MIRNIITALTICCLMFWAQPRAANAQDDDLDSFLEETGGEEEDRDAEVTSEGEDKGDEEAETPDDVASEEGDEEEEPEETAAEEEEGSPKLALPGFLFALNLGPFASFGGLVGGMVDVEFQFKLIEMGYLSFSMGYHGGLQIEADRNDSLISGALGYRHYLPVGSPRNAVSVMGGVSVGYYLTGPQDGDIGYDWTHTGLKLAGTYHWFLGNRISLGAGLGFALAFQYGEYLDAADDFVILMPEALFTVTF